MFNTFFFPNVRVFYSEALSHTITNMNIFFNVSKVTHFSLTGQIPNTIYLWNKPP